MRIERFFYNLGAEKMEKTSLNLKWELKVFCFAKKYPFCKVVESQMRIEREEGQAEKVVEHLVESQMRIESYCVVSSPCNCYRRLNLKWELKDILKNLTDYVTRIRWISNENWKK